MSDCNLDAEVTSVILATGVVFSVVGAPFETVVYSYWARNDTVDVSLVGDIRQPQVSVTFAGIDFYDLSPECCWLQAAEILQHHVADVKL